MASEGQGLIVEDLWVDYGGGPVVRGVNLSLEEGEIVAVVGPNGAGKTSTLASVAGFHRPFRGRIRYAGKELTGSSAEARSRRGIVLIPEGGGLISGLSVLDHLWLAAHRRPRGDVVDGVFNIFPQLKGLTKRKVGSLSGGESRMLSVAMALLRRPHVLLIDEMSLGLAPAITQVMLRECERLAKEDGIGVVLVEQFVEMALAIADRAMVLSNGEVVLEGPARELLTRMQDVQAAYFGNAKQKTYPTGPLGRQLP